MIDQDQDKPTGADYLCDKRQLAELDFHSSQEVEYLGGHYEQRICAAVRTTRQSGQSAALVIRIRVIKLGMPLRRGPRGGTAQTDQDRGHGTACPGMVRAACAQDGRASFARRFFGKNKGPTPLSPVRKPRFGRSASIAITIDNSRPAGPWQYPECGARDPNCDPY